MGQTVRSGEFGKLSQYLLHTVPKLFLPLGYISAVLQQSFRFAVFPKQYITFNPMQYVVMRHKKDDMNLFAEETDTDTENVKPLVI